jgi:hypothetical protein
LEVDGFSAEVFGGGFFDHFEPSAKKQSLQPIWNLASSFTINLRGSSLALISLGNFEPNFRRIQPILGKLLD